MEKSVINILLSIFVGLPQLECLYEIKNVIMRQDKKDQQKENTALLNTEGIFRALEHTPAARGVC